LKQIEQGMKALERKSLIPSDVPDSRGLQAFHGSKAKEFRHHGKVSSIM
jgi:hypothetical protein